MSEIDVEKTKNKPIAFGIEKSDESAKQAVTLEQAFEEAGGMGVFQKVWLVPL